MDLDRDICYRALATRDARFDGRFYTGVTSTGIYCRPVCPARTPKPEHCVFLPSAAAAAEAGFRPCLRCRPELAPGIAGWRGTEATVERALRLISEGALDEDGDVERLATRLGIGERHLRRLFDRHLGASPVSVAQTHRVLLAKRLIDETGMPMIDVAYAAGFGSIRRFNDLMRRVYGRSPSELRGKRRTAAAAASPSGIVLRLPFHQPYDWRSIIGFLATRAIPGVESVEEGCYRRTIAIDGIAGTVEVRPVEGAPWLTATVRIPKVAPLAAVISRLRSLFDLDADTVAIGAHLAADPLLAPLVEARPGLRVPGAWDMFELMVRAILGQQVSVAAATTLAGRLAAGFGAPLPAVDGAPVSGPGILFPRPEALAGKDLTVIGLPRARAAAISALAERVLAEPDLLSPTMPVESAMERLVALPGIGRWTAGYIAMRALRAPDAFPDADLALLRAVATNGERPTAAALRERAEAWRPWRAYAALHLWTADGAAATERKRSVKGGDTATNLMNDTAAVAATGA